jgi:uncharacterized protein involved in exopolysaccharide biosynthesis
MESTKTIQYAYVEEFDLWAILSTLWADRWLILLISGAFAIGGVSYSVLAQEWFRAQVVLSPTESKGNIGTLGQLGGLASLAGVSLPGASEGKPLAVLKSKDFAREFISDLKLTPIFLKEVRRTQGPPDIRDAVKFFDEKVRSVSEDKKTGLVTLTIRWKDPQMAASWANTLVERLNDRLRVQAEVEAARNVEFLQREIAASSVVSLQQSMGRVLEGEMQKLMLARGNEEFAFKIIDVASPPKERDSPKRVLISLLSLLVGVFLGMLVSFVRRAMAIRLRRKAV